jgi:hypothetical protein
MGAAMLKFAKSHRWTKYQDAYLLEQKDNLTIEEIARQLGLSVGQIRYRLKKLDIPKPIVGQNEEDTCTPGPLKDAHNWQGGSYWRLAPKQTWHKGFTGRLVHLSR